MKRAMDASDLKGALQHASDMLRELRTSLLTPRNYYELYMKVLDELHHLDDFFSGLCASGTQASELYEKAQACGDVLPRLYLLITVGAVYIKSRQAPAKDILNDLACKDKLPDAGSEYEGHGGDVSDAVDFVVNCKDSIAQPYLLDCIIQVFPDEFHLATLESFLTTHAARDKVNVRVILEAMMRRLASGARDAHQDGGGAVAAPVKAFAAFNSCATKLVEEKKGAIELGELLKLQGALLEFAIECYPGRLDYVNHCFGTCAAVLHASRPAADGEAPAPLDDGDAEELERCLSLPLGPAIGLTGVLELGLFGTLVAYLPWKRRKDVSRLAHLMVNDDTDATFKVLGCARKHFGQGGLQRIKHTLVPLVFRARPLAKDPEKAARGLGAIATKPRPSA
ncbi:hypothetical protein JL722_1587 [Aureococcus anophagefferens]|nr:hypothetical protein JL722_1587 [Aureococcus anophagefferens]